MKKHFYFILVIALIMVTPIYPLYAAEEGDKEQRFQLFNAAYNSALIQTSKTTVFDEKKLFKIDTKTGDTWMLIDIFKEGRDIKYWKKIKESSEN